MSIWSTTFSVGLGVNPHDKPGILLERQSSYPEPETDRRLSMDGAASGMCPDWYRLTIGLPDQWGTEACLDRDAARALRDDLSAWLGDR